MSRKKVIIEFDSNRTAVMNNGVLVKVCPSSVIRKASETPVAVAYGEDAEKRKVSLQKQEVYSNPLKNGKIVDEIAARAFFRSLFKDLYGRNTFLDVYVIVPGGLSTEDRTAIEVTFSACGCKSVTLIPRPVIIAALLGFNNLYCSLFMDSDITEFVIARDGEIISSHTIDVSLSALAEAIRNKFLEDNKLNLTAETSYNIASKYCSLFENDSTKITAEGKDSITSTKKSVFFTARDIYPLAENVYSKATCLIHSALYDMEDNELAKAGVKSGILFLGKGCRMCGFNEFVYHQIGVYGVSGTDDFVLMSLTHRLIEDDPTWLERL